MSAVILLQEMMLAKRLDPSAFNEDDDDLPAETSKDRTAVLAIAYHNMGVEQEFLRSYPAAILSYKKAVNFAEKNLGPEDGITQNLRNVFENAKVEVGCFSSLTLIFFWCSLTQRYTNVVVRKKEPKGRERNGLLARVRAQWTNTRCWRPAKIWSKSMKKLKTVGSGIQLNNKTLTRKTKARTSTLTAKCRPKKTISDTLYKGRNC